MQTPRTIKATWLVAILLSLATTRVDAADKALSISASRVKQIIAHRGASAERPECTPAAFERAIEVGATAVEVDVRTSRDGKLFILHDPTLDRTTNGHGPANQLALAELKQLDAGSWFEASYRAQRIPTLSETARQCRGRIDLLLDLKEQGDAYDRNVAKVIRDHGDPAKTIIGVRSIAQARRFRSLLPESRQLALIPDLNSIEDFARAGVDTIRLWPRWLDGDDEPIKRVRATGKQLHLNGTLGELQETTKLLTHNPDSLSSDHPKRLIETLKRIAGGNTAVEVSQSKQRQHDSAPAIVAAGELPPGPEGSFSIVVIPDTQQYRGRGTKGDDDSTAPPTNRVFDSWTDWIATNLARQNIVLVSHVGDIVDINNREQWTLARRCMDKLHGRVPYGISVGNHDLTSAGDASLFQEYFPRSRFSGFDWYGGCFEGTTDDVAISGNNVNSVQLFQAGGMKFVALHLECNAPDDVLAWADEILEEHADRRAMITTHMGLGPRDKPQTAEDYFDAPKGRMTWTKRHGSRGNSPQQMWDKCFKKHANLFLICCGDQSRTQAMRQVATGQHGNVVYELLSDYGSSGLRVMRFIPEANRIEVLTWDPLKGMLCTTTKIVADSDQHQFVLPYTMRP